MSPRSSGRGPLLSRGLLQHPPQALPARQPQPHRLREHPPDTERGVRLTGVTSASASALASRPPCVPGLNAAVRQDVLVPLDVSTVLASAGLSAVVAVNTAGIVAR